MPRAPASGLRSAIASLMRGAMLFRRRVEQEGGRGHGRRDYCGNDGGPGHRGCILVEWPKDSRAAGPRRLPSHAHPPKRPDRCPRRCCPRGSRCCGWPSSFLRCRCNWPSARSRPGYPIAIVEGPPQRPLDRPLQRRRAQPGSHAGMKLAAAQALVRDLIAVERHLEREREALDELAAWAYQFSGESRRAARRRPDRNRRQRALCSADARAWAVRYAMAWTQLGYHATFGYAATPRAARVVALARARRLVLPSPARHRPPRSRARTTARSRCSSGTMPTADTLHALGLATIGDLLALPRAVIREALRPRAARRPRPPACAMPRPAADVCRPRNALRRASSCRPMSPTPRS